ncbi:MAG: hypothetical protein JW751_30290 [Polyangiaceae bacterium]|nr:hypothetical protein [Polyangiaceae bacterium]
MIWSTEPNGFEVQVVDEIGEPVDGLEMVFWLRREALERRAVRGRGVSLEHRLLREAVGRPWRFGGRRGGEVRVTEALLGSDDGSTRRAEAPCPSRT